MLVLSSYREILYLDSDNVAVRDPETLFSEPMFQETGSLFWHDFWDADWAPDAPLVLGVNATSMPSSTAESGQMLLDKRRYDLSSPTAPN